MFERALGRANVPVRYSQGFNPRPRLRITLPRPVGVASLDELLVLELASPTEPDEVLSRLSGQLPAGITLVAAETLSERDRRLPYEACYSLPLEPMISEPVAKRAAAFMSKDRVEVDRPIYPDRGHKLINVRQYVVALGVAEDRLKWRQSITTTGTARADEVLTALELPSRQYLHKLRRDEVSYHP
jgi:radical SAM-linked protein